MAYESNDKRNDSIYSQRVRAGKRRTYFFDVRETRGNDYYLTITESRKKFNEDGYDRHKIFLYKEDFNKFLKGITEAIDYVKTELMPDFDFDVFSHDPEEPQARQESAPDDAAATEPTAEAPEAPAEEPAAAESPSEAPAEPSAEDSSSDESEQGGDPSLRDEHVDKW